MVFNIAQGNKQKKSVVLNMALKDGNETFFTDIIYHISLP